ncbi:hypothetical protein P171DRAFT_171120 [Karstenula rhodostoma CBS 690.94]|uniref:RING-type domain-containing protein n=1 Tax=Karstenula rhodostoma CBS 690.94 TaxID=1392251 RepID=A0A9P4P834_9PLEO|nr:hypothetical protein P171DRAFT_171120 [Karstenula rhodostoma CBS 690.94]
MADHKAARERCTTFLKEKTKPVDPQDLPVLDECPICLDNYVLEQCVQIKIEGCNHIFGRNCLTAILTNNPRLAKKCPLCRTVWMEAPTPAPALGSWARVAESHRSGQAAAAATADSVRRAHGGITLPSGAPGPRLLHEASVIGSRRLASPQVPGPPRLFRERQREDPVINLINSDDDQDVRIPTVLWWHG